MFSKRTIVASGAVMAAALIALFTGPMLWSAEDPATQPAAPADGQPNPTDVAPGQIAHIRLSGTIHESAPGISLFSPTPRPALDDWLRRLARIRNTTSVTAVALEIDAPTLTWAGAQELADAVRRLDAVKPVYAHLVSADTAGYLVASAARDVTIDPIGRIWMVGLNSEMMFFRGTLDWIGLEPQFIQIGRFKGAAEPMTNTEPSAELTGEIDLLLDDLFGQLCRHVAAQRRQTPEAVEAAINNGPFDASAARQYGLIDRQLDRRDWRQYVIDAQSEPGVITWSEDFGARIGPQIDLNNPFTILAQLAGPKEAPRRDPTIAIVHVDGMISSGAGGESFFGQPVAGAQTLTRVLADLESDPRVRAVVLRVNSPGGSAIASEMIYQAVERCARVKPVIASVSGMAASGGYYVAVAAPTIIADEAAILGSIGVVSGKLAMTGLLDHLGISTYHASRGQNAGLMSLRPWTEREMEIIRADAQRVYDAFLQRVRISRGERLAPIEQVAEGRIFTAPRAADLGLIDRVGTLNDAVAAAMDAAGVNRCDFITLPKPRSLLDLLSGDGDDSTSILALPDQVSVLTRLIARQPGAAYLLNLADLLMDEPILTAMPMHVSIR